MNESVTEHSFCLLFRTKWKGWSPSSKSLLRDIVLILDLCYAEHRYTMFWHLHQPSRRNAYLSTIPVGEHPDGEDDPRRSSSSRGIDYQRHYRLVFFASMQYLHHMLGFAVYCSDNSQSVRSGCVIKPPKDSQLPLRNFWLPAVNDSTTDRLKTIVEAVQDLHVKISMNGFIL